MNHDSYDAGYIRDILQTVKAVAVVGASNNPVRPSYFVMQYLMDKGYSVIPVNPGLGGQEILGQRVYSKLADIQQPVDMVDIFRNSDAAASIVEETLALTPLPSAIWMQLGVRNDAAAAQAEAAGLKVVMNRCPKIEYGKLSGEWTWMGGNTGAISSRAPALHGNGRVQSLGLSPRKT
jgi:predicted CoA-binding protein